MFGDVYDKKRKSVGGDGNDNNNIDNNNKKIKIEIYFERFYLAIRIKELKRKRVGYSKIFSW